MACGKNNPKEVRQIFPLLKLIKERMSGWIATVWNHNLLGRWRIVDASLQGFCGLATDSILILFEWLIIAISLVLGILGGLHCKRNNEPIQV